MKSHQKKLTLFLLALGFCTAAYSQEVVASSCRENDQIDSSKRQEVNAAALDFVQTLLGSNPAAAFSSLSEEGKKAVPDEMALVQAATLIQQFKPADLKVEHTYVINIFGKSPGRVVCGKSLSKPDEWVSVVAADLPEQAYVSLSAEAINNQFAFTVWLVPGAGGWKVQSFSMNMGTLANEGPDQLWERARAQKANGHNLNAALLYFAAMQTINRGPNLQLGLADAISKDASEYQLPPEIEGQPPFEWKAPDMTFEVLSVGPIAVGGKIYIVIQDESPPWHSNDQIDGWNRKLIAWFKGRFPEYSDAFAGIVVRANEQGTHRGYGTVDEVSSKAQ
ncbi:MAG TPA: hypothetical protein VK819_04400 [Acidobacteriaceae bacterium]|nr:hypothetical protein [Acidobacteriaceae bacterium]